MVMHNAMLFNTMWPYYSWLNIFISFYITYTVFLASYSLTLWHVILTPLSPPFFSLPVLLKSIFFPLQPALINITCPPMASSGLFSLVKTFYVILKEWLTFNSNTVSVHRQPSIMWGPGALTACEVGSDCVLMILCWNAIYEYQPTIVRYEKSTTFFISYN